MAPLGSPGSATVIVIKRAPTCHLLCKRPDATTAPARHIRDRIFELSPIHASMIIRFPEFSEITELNESFAPFRRNSNGYYSQKIDTSWRVDSLCEELGIQH